MKYTEYTNYNNKTSDNDTIAVRPYATKGSAIHDPLMTPVMTYNNKPIQIEYYCRQDLGCY